MNVPKTRDKKLIAALRLVASDYASEEGVIEALLNEAADRLAELTQPQPIETAPVGVLVRAFGGMIEDEHDEQNKNTRGVTVMRDYPNGAWCVDCSFDVVIKPTHWLPCVKVDIATLEGKSDGH